MIKDTNVDVRAGHVCIIANGGIIRMLTADEAEWLAEQLTQAAGRLDAMEPDESQAELVEQLDKMEPGNRRPPLRKRTP